MPVFTYLLVACAAYLLGSIPSGFLLVRLFLKEDIRAKGSGNIGATNVVRAGGKGLGALTFLLDACKGYLAVVLANQISLLPGVTPVPHQNALAVAALCAIIGHLHPVWLGFKGGKGVATAFGVFIALAPWAALGALAVFGVTFALSRYVSLASLFASIAFPIFALTLPHADRGVWLTAVLMFIPVMVIVKHNQNIVRLVRGTEYRFGKPGEKPTRTTSA
jgi:acyl phosphate:glycerol-3-phosphate acyltransferase